MPFYSPSTRGFYIESVHRGGIPSDAVKITQKRHRELMLAQSQGHEIVPGPNGPEIHRVDGPEVIFARALGAVKREARRRILAIASLERQSNDNALLALGTSGDPNYEAALARRRQIDAVRTASNTIEQALGSLKPEKLMAFDAARADWPAE